MFTTESGCMEVEFHDWGGIVVNARSVQLDQVVEVVHKACLDNSACEVVEVRIDNETHHQTIVVDLGDGSFSTDNDVGICRVERLALSYQQGREFCWEVRALRKDFPVTIHQNHVSVGQPRSLCLYIDPWSSIERSWTPELFLQRIFWWLRATAEGTIHGSDQPIEQLFFSSPITVLLPEGYFDSDMSAQKKLFFEFRKHPKLDEQTLVGSYSDNQVNQSSDTPLCMPVSVMLDPVENGPIEEYAGTLGQLQQTLESRGSDILAPLKSAIDSLAADGGIEVQNARTELVLLILGIPRSREGTIERTEIQGFIVDSKIGDLGESLSVLLRAPEQNVWYRDSLQSGGDDRWKEFQLDPVGVKCFPSKGEIRQYSGLSGDDEGPNGVIAGVGALGGLLAKIWKRECWGSWTYIDKDIVQPHNIARHIGSYHCVGYPKSHIVDALANDIHTHANTKNDGHFVSDILANDTVIQDTISGSDLVIDATTTLNVPRTLSLKEDCPRTVSVFISPSGMAAVMLLEDECRNVRCSHLEAQYYRSILNSDWGEKHLNGHLGRYWVGGGCRDVTVVLSDELVHLHAATLARQVRKASKEASARVSIWECNDDTGAVIAHDVPVSESHSKKVNEWEIIWDDGLLDEARRYRAESLPEETGGIVFGVIDQKDRTITLVKACSAPPNSQSSRSSFSRGAYESSDILDDCHERTAGVVSYVGEWHSHPAGCNALPSQDDIGQLEFITSALRAEGMPALMMIISESSVGIYLDGSGVIIE